MLVSQTFWQVYRNKFGRKKTEGNNTSGTLYGTGLSHSGGDTGTNASPCDAVISKLVGVII